MAAQILNWQKMSGKQIKQQFKKSCEIFNSQITFLRFGMVLHDFARFYKIQQHSASFYTILWDCKLRQGPAGLFKSLQYNSKNLKVEKSDND